VRVLDKLLDTERWLVVDSLLLDEHVRISRHVAAVVLLLALLLGDDRVRAGGVVGRTMALDLEGLFHLAVAVLIVKLTHKVLGLRLPVFDVPLRLEFHQDLVNELAPVADGLNSIACRENGKNLVLAELVVYIASYHLLEFGLKL